VNLEANYKAVRGVEEGENPVIRIKRKHISVGKWSIEDPQDNIRIRLECEALNNCDPPSRLCWRSAIRCA
jgi:hypothetical protein